MSEKTEIIFMQTRLVRLASEEWKMSYDSILEIFKDNDVFTYIENGYGIFHCEGDGAILEDILKYLEKKGTKICLN